MKRTRHGSKLTNRKGTRRKTSPGTSHGTKGRKNKKGVHGGRK